MDPLSLWLFVYCEQMSKRPQSYYVFVVQLCFPPFGLVPQFLLTMNSEDVEFLKELLIFYLVWQPILVFSEGYIELQESLDEGYTQLLESSDEGYTELLESSDQGYTELLESLDE